jgi:hypothetical protein
MPADAIAVEHDALERAGRPDAVPQEHARSRGDRRRAGEDRRQTRANRRVTPTQADGGGDQAQSFDQPRACHDARPIGERFEVRVPQLPHFRGKLPRKSVKLPRQGHDGNENDEREQPGKLRCAELSVTSLESLPQEPPDEKRDDDRFADPESFVVDDRGGEGSERRHSGREHQPVNGTGDRHAQCERDERSGCPT